MREGAMEEVKYIILDVKITSNTNKRPHRTSFFPEEITKSYRY